MFINTVYVDTGYVSTLGGPPCAYLKGRPSILRRIGRTRSPFGAFSLRTQGTLSSISEPLIHNVLQRLTLLGDGVPRAFGNPILSWIICSKHLSPGRAPVLTQVSRSEGEVSQPASATSCSSRGRSRMLPTGGKRAFWKLQSSGENHRH
jgi:hypothetical protein